MAAVTAAMRGKRVILLEKNREIGSKLLLTGEGRGNITNMAGADTFINSYRNGKFLINAFHRFFNQDLCDFFENAGLKLKTERGKRVYPVSDKSGDIVRILKNLLIKNKVQLHLKEKADKIYRRKDFFEVFTDRKKVAGEKIILACGGKSFPDTGSEGDGYLWAEELGHTVISPMPALCGLVIKEKFIKNWESIKLKNVTLRCVTGKKTVSEEFGEVIFTRYGISGAAVFNISGDVSENLKKGKTGIAIDFKPALNREILNDRLQREFSVNKKLKNVMKNVMPSGLIDEFLLNAGIDGEKKTSQVSKKERNEITENLKGLKLTVKKTRGFRYSMITRGGVSVKEINPVTMESKILPGLYFTGEIIDVDGKTGGYNLQAAFSTGYIAGSSV
jgi:predicted Rossmann fold flavoprotein